MKRAVVIVIPVVLVLFVLLHQRYLIKTDYDPYVTVLTTTNEAFLFVGKTTSGHSGSLVGMIIKEFIQIYPLAAVDERNDLIVVHVKDSRTDTFELKGFDYAGSAFPFKGDLYFGRGGPMETGPLLWKWNGSNFIKLDQKSALAIRESFTYTDTLLKAEGWEESSLRLSADKPETSFPLDPGRCLLTLKGQRTNGHSAKIIQLRGEGINIPQQSLAEIEDGFRSVKKATYNKEFGVE